jgi:DNA uptake protein ComE-like DNA-binding protein
MRTSSGIADRPEPVATQAKQRGAANWVWLSLIPFGLGAWAPVYAGAVVRKRSWVVLGLLWSMITLAGWVVAIANHGGAAGGLLIIVGWAGAIASSFAIRASYRQLVGSPLEAALAGAEQRLSDRDRARKLAAERPAVAKELGIGRPDLPNAQDAGLIDVNNAPASVLTKLPGIDDALATKIVETRAETHGFSSVEDLGVALDLDGNLVEDLRDRVVFLPR